MSFNIIKFLFPPNVYSFPVRKCEDGFKSNYGDVFNKEELREIYFLVELRQSIHLNY